MIPCGPLILRKGRLDPVRCGTSQPFNLCLSRLLIIKSADLFTGAVSRAQNVVGMLIALVPFWIRSMDRPHDRHIPAFRDVLGELSRYLNTNICMKGVGQSQDYLTGHTGIAAVLGAGVDIAGGRARDVRAGAGRRAASRAGEGLDFAVVHHCESGSTG